MQPVLPVIIPRQSDLTDGTVDPGWAAVAALGWADSYHEFNTWAANQPLEADGSPPRNGGVVASLLQLVQRHRGRKFAGSVTEYRTGIIRPLPEPLPLTWRGKASSKESIKDRPTFPGYALQVTLRFPATGTPPALILQPSSAWLAQQAEKKAASLPTHRANGSSPSDDDFLVYDPETGYEVPFSALEAREAAQTDTDTKLTSSTDSVSEDSDPVISSNLDDEPTPEPHVLLLPHTKLSPDPDSWWPLELLFRLDPSLVAGDWSEGTSEPKLPSALMRVLLPTGSRDYDDACADGSAIRAVLNNATIPLKPSAAGNGRWQLDFETWALELVHARHQSTGELPQLYLVTRRAPPVIWERAMKLLRAVHRGRLFRTSVEPGKRHGQLALVAAIGGQDGMDIFSRENDFHRLLGLSLLFPTQKYGMRQPPANLIKVMQSAPDPDLPELRGITRMPICQPDGTIIDEAGYDPITREWLDSTIKLNVPERPTDRHVVEALNVLNVLFQDFSFDLGSGAYAGTLACLFDQIIRPLVKARSGPRPLYVFEARAHGQGSGKSLLATVIASAISGKVQPATPWKGAEEFSKSVVGWLQEGRPFVLIDNVTTMIRSDVLDLLMTTTEFTQRQLGVNATPTLPQNTTFAMTANGVHFSRDIARRTVMIGLAKGDEPDHYAIREIVAYAVQHRDTIISAAYTILRAWMQAGEPDGPKIDIKSFESWIRITSGLLNFIGVTGLDKCVAAARDRDADSNEDKTFIEVWAERHGEAPVTTNDLITLAEAHLLYPRRLDKPNDMVKARNIAEHTKSLIGATFNGWKVEIARKRSPIVFKLARQSDAQRPGS